jgi:aminopeptidase YwaD
LPEVDDLAAEAMALLEEITSEISPRESATDQELEAAQFLSAKFESLGYEVSLESFEVRLTTADVELSSVDVTTPGELQTFPMGMSVEASASGALTSVGMAFEEDIPAEGLMGRVALIQRGTITFQLKVSRVAEAGAVAAIVFNNRDGNFGGALSTESTIPAVSLSGDQGRALLALLELGEVMAKVSVETRTLQSRNVVAEKPGPPGDAQVVLGGHYDTVAGIPGANDNGSGIATVLTIARAIADRSYPFTVRFILFGSEELGLRGSSDYVRGLSDEQRAATLAMLNFDALGTGDTLGVLGESELALAALSVGRELGIRSARRRFSGANLSSDHAPFNEAGIPTVFFMADDISRIHTPEDKLEFVRPELLGGSAVLGIALLAALSEG